MGLLNSGFAAGMAGAFQDIARQQIATWTAEDVARERERMDIAHEKRIEEMRIRQESRAEERAAAPAKRYAGLLHSKMNEDVPVEAAPVTKLDSDSSALLQDGASDPGIKGSFKGDMNTMRDIAARAQAVLQNPSATPAQKEDAQNILAVLEKQVESQQGLNQKAVEGKTRKRTFDEANEEARREAAMTDPQAFMAGETMFAGERKDAREERKLGIMERTKQRELDSRERIETMKQEGQWERLEAKIDAKLGGGKGAQPTALMQNVDFLKSLGYGADKIEKFIFDRKEISVEEIASKILAADKFGEVTPEQAAQKAVSLRNAIQSAGSKPAPAASASNVSRPPLSSFRK